MAFLVVGILLTIAWAVLLVWLPLHLLELDRLFSP
jgi:hypothetical protein